MTSVPSHRQYMAEALELARRGEGHVEPNPMVGCVVVKDHAVVGRGWHARFGGPHAEVGALKQAGEHARGATLYVTLEPCCHHGKTPPCTDAILQAGVTHVVVGEKDPFPKVAGGGVQQLTAAGVDVQWEPLDGQIRHLLAPYLKRVTQGRPWVILKWAMTADGKLATTSGDSRWISNERSRALVHQLRGRVDAVIVGKTTALRDDPLLTARPPGPRRAARIVLDSRAELPDHLQLVQTAQEIPTWIAAAPGAPRDRLERLERAGCQVLVVPGETHVERWLNLLDELGRHDMTNVLVEGGASVLGTIFDSGDWDEAHIFIAPKLVGGRTSLSPVAGRGMEQMTDAVPLMRSRVETIGGDIHLHGYR